MLALQAQGAYLTSDIHDQMDPAVAVMYRPFRRYWIDRTRPDTVGSMPTKIRRCNFWDPTIAPSSGWTWLDIEVFLAENVAGEPPSPKLPKDAGPTRTSRTLEDTLETSLNN
ncbi:hypothetical protein PGT21_010510 [Puccinia graminis f. sp. tritici]|uniref:Uncharacterized protein n=1 Tax=Puccinia graminis f. sp. tritici TaxID=56615 RepID=A0A5B0Q5L1_PUCGR|nr:hypothetical protein PGT21_010510 [Puccinia graminis f. sp. tritici]